MHPVTRFVVARGGVPVAIADTRPTAQRRALLEERADWAADRLHTWRQERDNVWRLYVESTRTTRFNRTWWTVREVPHITPDTPRHTPSTTTNETVGSAP